MKQKLKKGFAWLKAPTVRFLLSALLGVIFGCRKLLESFVLIAWEEGKRSKDEAAEVLAVFEGIIYFLFFLFTFYLLVAWLYSDNKTEETT